VRSELRDDRKADRKGSVNAEIGPATAGDVADIRRLLADSALPTADLASAPIQFWVARRAQVIVGAVALERYAATGLLRSLVVNPQDRSGGLGRALVARLEADARLAGVASLVLLTQTAEPFFAKCGYHRIDRGSVSGDVLSSAQFRSLCPASATCLSKSLTAQ